MYILYITIYIIYMVCKRLGRRRLALTMSMVCRRLMAMNAIFGNMAEYMSAIYIYIYMLGAVYNG